jgi:hypothetical protein
MQLHAGTLCKDIIKNMFAGTGLHLHCVSEMLIDTSKFINYLLIIKSPTSRCVCLLTAYQWIAKTISLKDLYSVLTVIHSLLVHKTAWTRGSQTYIACVPLKMFHELLALFT